MNLSDRLSEIEILFGTILKNHIQTVSQSIRRRIRILFLNNAILDVRYPKENKYSFNLRYADLIFRIDTAPHHQNLGTFPNHYHCVEEENVIPDNWTNVNNTIQENIQGICQWILEIFQEY